MFKLAVFVALAAVALAAPMDEFEAFKAQFGKTYHSADEEQVRRNVFEYNLKFIEKHNAEFEQGLHGHTVGVNEFADMTNEEFAAAYTTTFTPKTERHETFLPVPMTLSGVEDSVDWRTKGAVTPVKNQGQCGSCWSFSTTGSMEGAVQIATGKLVSLSEQQLMDCSHAEGNNGCEGGLMDNAFKYIIKNGGLDTEEDYSYKARDESCESSKAGSHAAEIEGFTDVPRSEEQLMAAIAKGPVSIAIEADQRGFQMYKSGVFTGPCGQNLDHGVLAVGYGSDSGKDYWIVKNSWGPAWGDEGYIRIERGKNLCGITNVASYPTGGKLSTPKSTTLEFAAPQETHYEDPGASKSCQSGEIAVQITGLKGDFCSPSCAGTGSCPSDVPAGTTAKPECVLEKAGSSKPTYCALICTPGQDDTCPQNASCKAISGTGICTYDD